MVRTYITDSVCNVAMNTVITRNVFQQFSRHTPAQYLAHQSWQQIYLYTPVTQWQIWPHESVNKWTQL